MKSPANADPLHPFNFPKEGPRARAFTPDVMERFESASFPEYARCAARIFADGWYIHHFNRSPEKDAYLLMRNLILALWHDDCTVSLCVVYHRRVC